jgi:long-subunit acyl-CoA synthetase (AMP-forming)
MAMTILDYFLKWERETPGEIFLRQPNGKAWTNYTWEQVGIEARKALGALQHHGYQPGDRIALMSANCAQWIIFDLALMMGGYISVPLYANVNANAMQKILQNAGARALFLGKLLPKDWNNLKPAIPESVQTTTLDGYTKAGIQSWQEFLENASEPTLITPSSPDVVTIIYTSGTTGDPKGVVHTFGSIMNAVAVASNAFQLNRKGNRFISYLPLSHAAERGLIESGGIYCGGSIAFVESADTFAENLQAVAPTHFFGVPRIWEKFQVKILGKISQPRLNFLLKIPLVAGMIRSRIKKSLGLQQADVIVSGAAPIAPELLRWFQKLDIFICEAYGLSEDFSVLSIHSKDDIRIGTVGKLFDKQEVYLDPDTHEIRQKCNWLMQGYYNNPELTAKTIVNGFLYTGDMGHLSDDGFLTITGRVKDIFKTTKGEYISPTGLEMNFSGLSIVDQACVMGSQYPKSFVLIVLSEIGRAMSKIEVEKRLKEVLHTANLDAMEYQKLKKAIVVKEEWTIENDLLTPTLKMKRNVLSQKYESALKTIYARDEMVSWE